MTALTRALDIVIDRAFTDLDREVIEVLLAQCERDVYAETVSATGTNPGQEGGTS